MLASKRDMHNPKVRQLDNAPVMLYPHIGGVSSHQLDVELSKLIRSSRKQYRSRNQKSTILSVLLRTALSDRVYRHTHSPLKVLYVSPIAANVCQNGGISVPMCVKIMQTGIIFRDKLME